MPGRRIGSRLSTRLAAPRACSLLALLLASSFALPAEPPPLVPRAEGGVIKASAPKLDAPSPPVEVAPAPPEAGDQSLPINLATALRLSNARPLIVAAAQERVQIAAAQLQRANVLWTPSINLGADFYRHDGAVQVFQGNIVSNSRNTLLLGAGPQAWFAVTDAIFLPLAARQVVAARTAEVQAARNDSLLLVAEAYFHVQQSRGNLAGLLDTVRRSKEFVAKTQELARGFTSPFEINRARTQLENLEQLSVEARERWRLASADLTRILRFNPGALIQPVEPPHLQVTIVDKEIHVDELIRVGLVNRPELAAQQALVRAAIERLRQERMRPLTPSVVLQGAATPGNTLAGGLFGSGLNSSLSQFQSRSDFDMQLIWQLENLGLGNRARINERRAEQRLSVVELFKVQDHVAAEVAQAYAQVVSAESRIKLARTGLAQAIDSLDGNVRGLAQTIRTGDVLVLVTRPQEVVQALDALALSYENYFRSTAEYNRAQFRLFRAIGFPSESIACRETEEPQMNVDGNRPPEMAPAPPADAACSGCVTPFEVGTKKKHH